MAISRSIAMSDPTAAAAQAQLATFYSIIRQQQVESYSSMAAFALLVYDVTLEFPREYEYIWSAKWSIPKALHIFIRYYGLIHVGVQAIINTQVDVSVDICNFWTLWISIGGVIVIATAVNVILVIRLNALYKQSPRVLWFLIVLSVAEFVAELYVTIDSHLHSEGIPPVPGFPYHGCLVKSTAIPYLFLISWIPTSVVAAIFFGMTVWKLLKSVKQQGGFILKYNRNKSPLLTSFARDGAIFFFLIALILFVSTIITITVKGPLQGVTIPWLSAVYSFAGSRLVINLREAAMEQKKGPSWTETMQLNTLQFSAPPLQHSSINDHGISKGIEARWQV